MSRSAEEIKTGDYRSTPYSTVVCSFLRQLVCSTSATTTTVLCYLLLMLLLLLYAVWRGLCTSCYRLYIYIYISIDGTHFGEVLSMPTRTTRKVVVTPRQHAMTGDFLASACLRAPFWLSLIYRSGLQNHYTSGV